MKELLIPWNNWHSFKSLATYLSQSAPAARRWPVASSPRLGGALKGAEDLESSIIAAITQFNERRVNAALARSDRDGNVVVDGSGMSRVVEARRLLRPLFFTTEFNAVSSEQKSGLHPFPQVSTGGPSQDVFIPDSVFQLSEEEIIFGAKDLYERWPKLPDEEKRHIIEAITEKIIVGKDEVDINLYYAPPAPPAGHSDGSPNKSGGSIPPGTPSNRGKRAMNPQGRVALLQFVPIRLKALKPKETDFEPQTLGQHLRKRRLELRLTQRQVAGRLGVNAWTVLNWEKENTVPPFEAMPSILRWLGYDPYPAPQTLRERMEAKRREMGWSIREAAHHVGVDEGTWAAWEAGTTILKGGFGRLLAGIL